MPTPAEKNHRPRSRQIAPPPPRAVCFLFRYCSDQKRSPRRSAVVVAASSVVPRAPLPSEAAAESDGHAVPCVWQALQALHSGLEASAGPSHVPVGQHASHESPPPLEVEIRPLLESIDIPIICAYVLQAETAAALAMQVPEAPVHISQPIIENPPRSPGQVLEVQVESIVTVSPSQLLHVHVVLPAVGGSERDTTIEERQGGHASVTAQQPLLPVLEPSAHVAAEAPAANTSTTTNAVSLPTKAIRAGRTEIDEAKGV